MPAFATHDELAARLGIELTVEEETRADALLELASAVIQEEAGQVIERVEDDVLTLRGVPSRRLRLPERPVESVSGVVLAGETLDEGDHWYLEGDELVRTGPVFGFWPSIGYGFGNPDQELVITYTHGFATIPGAIKAVCLEAVVRVWVNPASVRQEGYGSEQVAYQAGNGLVLTEYERRVVHRALRRSGGTITFR